MKRGNFAAGAMLASLAAGPAFLASLALAAWATAAPGTYTMLADGRAVGPMAGITVLAIPFGFVLSMIPNVIGSWFMHGIAIGNQALRLPVAWAIAGAGTAALPFVFIPEPSGMLGMAFAVTGASCALVAHRFTTWA